MTSWAYTMTPKSDRGPDHPETPIDSTGKDTNLVCSSSKISSNKVSLASKHSDLFYTPTKSSSTTPDKVLVESFGPFHKYLKRRSVKLSGRQVRMGRRSGNAGLAISDYYRNRKNQIF